MAFTIPPGLIDPSPIIGKKYKFIKQVTLNGTWSDGHVPTPSRTFNIGDEIDGTCSPATIYPVGKSATIHTLLPNGEVYTVDAKNLDGDCGKQQTLQNKSIFSLKNVLIGFVIIIGIIVILKIFKVF